jgi:hypothetical protein
MGIGDSTKPGVVSTFFFSSQQTPVIEQNTYIDVPINTGAHMLVVRADGAGGNSIRLDENEETVLGGGFAAGFGLINYQTLGGIDATPGFNDWGGYLSRLIIYDRDLSNSEVLSAEAQLKSDWSL